MSRSQSYQILVALASSRRSNRSFLQGFARFARSQTNWRVLFIDSNTLDEATLNQTLKDFSGTIDGIVAKEDAASLLRNAFKDKNLPIAVFGHAPDGRPHPNTAFFSIDDPLIGRIAARYFLGLGNFASYGFYASSRKQNFIKLRVRGFTQELALHNHVPSVSFSYESPKETRDWIQSLPRPAAVFCACDLFAVRLLDLCRNMKYEIPKQISILGVDNDEIISLFAQPTLSSIDLSHDELGYAAAKALATRLRLGRHDDRHSVTLSQNTVIERDSTSAPAPATHLIRNALTFIRENAAHRLTAEEVARHLGVSRKLLERRFREMGEVPIHETILRRRLEHLRHELQLSVKPIHVITESCGFRNPTWIKTLFRQRFGLTMSEFRLRTRK